MKPPRIVILLLLLNLEIVAALAQDNPVPPAVASPESKEIKRWIDTTDGVWQAAYEREVTGIRDAEAEKLKAQYLAVLETGIAKASQAADLEGAVALRNERNRFSETKVFPDHDEPGDAPLVKQIRASSRIQFARVEADRMTRAKALLAKYDHLLEQAQTQWTKQGRIDDALLVRTKREEVASHWLAGASKEPLKPVAPAPAKTLAPSPATEFTKSLANTVWNWGRKPNDSESKTLLTIYPDETVCWSDRPSLHVHYEVLGNLSIRVRDAVWTFSDDLQSFTVKPDNAASASRWGKRTKAVP